jgi:CO dehydrogenase maturation factor
MIIGFLGKGGSGKTTLATMYTKYLLNKDNFEHIRDLNINGNRVLALDNDHNMDFKFNLGFEDDMNWMGSSLQEIFEKIAISTTRDVAELDEDYLFFLNPEDEITSKYSREIEIDGEVDGVKNKLKLMVSGPHNEEIMYGNACSHALTTPLKVYLPLLKLNENEYVIVDEKAGTDGVGTGVTTGFNLAVVVAEATTHGIKAAKQIIDMLKFYRTPFVVAVNKIRPNFDFENIRKEFEDMGADTVLKFDLNLDVVDLKTNQDYKNQFEKLYTISKEISDDRRKRTKERIEKQREFNSNKNK